MILDLFAKNNELSLFLLGQSSQNLGDLQRAQSFIVFPSHFYMNATVSSHGKGSADGLLSEGEIWVIDMVLKYFAKHSVVESKCNNDYFFIHYTFLLYNTSFPLILP